MPVGVTALGAMGMASGCGQLPCLANLLLYAGAVVCCAACAEAEVVPVRQIDNSAVLTAQLARLSAVKQSRSDQDVAAALQVRHTCRRLSARIMGLPGVSVSHLVAIPLKGQHTAQ
jgi:hypothetical protein